MHCLCMTPSEHSLSRTGRARPIPDDDTPRVGSEDWGWRGWSGTVSSLWQPQRSLGKANHEPQTPECEWTTLRRGQGVTRSYIVSYIVCTKQYFWGGVSSHDKLPGLAHQKALEKSLGIKDLGCPGLQLSHKAAWSRTSHVVRIKLHRIPGNAAGTATPVGIPVCYWSTRQTGRLRKSQRCAAHRKRRIEERGLH